MADCPSCSAALVPGARFCRECGADVAAAPPAPPDTATCAGCGAELVPGARFCRSCALPVPDQEPPPPPPAESTTACARCNADLPPEARFCRACGSPVGAEVEPAHAPAEESAQEAAPPVPPPPPAPPPAPAIPPTPVAEMPPPPAAAPPATAPPPAAGTPSAPPVEPPAPPPAEAPISLPPVAAADPAVAAAMPVTKPPKPPPAEPGPPSVGDTVRLDTPAPPADGADGAAPGWQPPTIPTMPEPEDVDDVDRERGGAWWAWRGLPVAIIGAIVVGALTGLGIWALIARSDEPATTTVATVAAPDAATDTAAAPGAVGAADTTAPPTTAVSTTQPPATTTTTTPPTTPPTELGPVSTVPDPASGPPFRSWTVILDSFASCSGSSVLFSTEYPSLTPGLCVRYEGAATTEDRAEQIAQGCSEDGCYVRYLGTGPQTGRWVVVLDTLDARTTTWDEMRTVADNLDRTLDLPFQGAARAFLSDDYAGWEPGLWVLFSRDHPSRGGAIEWCDEIGLASSRCEVVRLVRVDGD